MPTAEISRQRLELEEAIRRVERETSAMPAGAPVKVAPSRVAEAPAGAPPPRQAHPPPQQRQAPSRQSPADVFRRAIQDAEQREVDEEQQPRLERAVAARSDSGWANERPERVDRPVPPPARTTEAPAPARDFTDEPPAPADEPRLAPDYDNGWQQQPRAPEPGYQSGEPSLRGEGRERAPSKTQPRRGPRRPTRVEEEDLDESIEEAGRPSRLPAIVLGILILAMLVALGALGWSQRDMLADILRSYDGPAQPASDVAQVPQPLSGKDTDRLLAGEAPAAGGDVRVVAPDDANGAQPASTALSLQAPGDAAAPAAPSLDADALVAQRAALYEEPTEANAEVVPVNAAVTWSFVESGPNGPEVIGNVDVPDRSMTFRIAIRRNVDDSLPASHIVEIMVNAPDGQTVRDIPRIVFKQTEDGRGQQLIGAPAQVADGFFWIALSNVPADVRANLGLLGGQMWIDLPFIYENGRRAILTFEKGTPGERVFARALDAWTG